MFLKVRNYALFQDRNYALRQQADNTDAAHQRISELKDIIDKRNQRINELGYELQIAQQRTRYR